ncbi:sigma-54 dependent transcriptional regulator [soil metagenome]
MGIQEAPFQVWIVEDDEWYSEFLRYSVSLIPEYEATVFRTGKELLSRLHESPDVITLDFQLPDTNGAALLKKIREANPDIQVLAISNQEKIDTAMELLRGGAYDYLVKSDDLREKLLNTLQHLYKNRTLKRRIDSLEREVGNKFTEYKNIIGKSEPMKKVFVLIGKASQNNIIASITGETGTGKEEIAKAIHFNSSYGKGPFVAVNMAAIPRELAESELFGHEKGSFTGAMNSRTGRFEEANDGTLFLDEIGELDLSLQAKLLRVLQEREVSRIGSNKTHKINCRILVATHRNLLEEVKQKRFREDLYYRLLGLQIQLPPLRERGGDVLLLARHFVQQFCKDNKMDVKEINKEGSEKLMRYPFPGNIRELKSVVELAVVMSNDTTIAADDIILNQQESALIPADDEMTLDEFNKKIVLHYLAKYNDNITLVASKLGIGKSTIYRLLKREQSKEDQG